MAPSKVEARLSRRLRRWGRIDAKKYENLRDYTRTHAVIWMDEVAKTGQSDVNLWYTTQCEPLLAGNERIHVDIERLEGKIEKLRQLTPTTGRERARLEAELDRLGHDLMNFEAQRRTNRARGLMFRRHAEEALTSWQTFRDLMASIYTRARAIESQAELASSQAEVPAYEPVPLTVIPQLEDDTLDDFAPSPRPSSPRQSPRNVTDLRGATDSTGATGGVGGADNERGGRR